MFPLMTLAAGLRVPAGGATASECYPGVRTSPPNLTAMMKVLCLNGPNLDRLGRRQPEVYGTATLRDLEEMVGGWAAALGLEVETRQSNSEGELVAAIHGCNADGIVLNPGALTHSSPALADAIAAVDIPVVEVHISNVRSRARWRHRSYIEPVAVATIFGRGFEGYRAALRHLLNRASVPFETVRYGPHPDQVMDVRSVPEATSGVVLIHGGFWLDAWGRDTVESWAVDLHRRQVPSASLEFRRLGSGGGVAATSRDVSDAVRLALERSGWERTAVLGHSSGGHLAGWAGATLGSQLDLVVAVAGIFDLERAVAAGVGGGAVERFDPLASASLVRLGAPPVPVSLVHGHRDDVVPVDQSHDYLQFLKRAGAVASLDVVDEAHFSVLSPGSEGWARACARLAEHGFGAEPTR